MPTSPNDGPRVLIVDDEANIRDALAFNLRREGFDVVLAGTGPEAVDKLRLDPDLILLDVMLPGFDGLEVLRRVRQTSSIPVLMLSARGEEIDRVLGLEIGADDYITKPFAMREVTARIRAILRRTGVGGDFSARVETEPATAQDAVLATLGVDPKARAIQAPDGLQPLKPKEFDLLMYFIRHPGVVLSRDALLREVWGYDYPVDTRTVDVHMRWLRQKLEDDPANPQIFLTVRGHGYRFVPPVATGQVQG